MLVTINKKAVKEKKVIKNGTEDKRGISTYLRRYSRISIKQRKYCRYLRDEEEEEEDADLLRLLLLVRRRRPGE